MKEVLEQQLHEEYSEEAEYSSTVKWTGTQEAGQPL